MPFHEFSIQDDRNLELERILMLLSRVLYFIDEEIFLRTNQDFISSLAVVSATKFRFCHPLFVAFHRPVLRSKNDLGKVYRMIYKSSNFAQAFFMRFECCLFYTQTSIQFNTNSSKQIFIGPSSKQGTLQGITYVQDD